MQSIPYQLSQGVVQALRDQFEPTGAIVRDNPTSKSALSAGDRILFVEDWEDGPIAQPNQAERRTFSLNIGVINRTADDRTGADADMVLAKEAASKGLLVTGRALKATGALHTFAAPREGKRIYRVEGLDVGGALIVTRLEIDYVTPPVTTTRT